LHWGNGAAENLFGKKDYSSENPENRRAGLVKTELDTEAAPSRARKIAEKMSFSQLAGQVMMIGYAGSVPSPETFRWIRENEVGGIKIFGWNTNDLTVLRNSIEEMQRAALQTEFKLPLFIATDQEGGWIRHVRGNTSITPGNMALGAAGIMNDSYMSGFFIGKEMKALGINMNFAPTIDILINQDAYVIGPRAFSDDALQTAILATAFANGTRSAGIIATAKHFPGHGRTPVDSHGRLPVLDTTLDELFSADLLPYEFLIRENIPAIMSGHLAFPVITGHRRPASLCSFFLQDVLRRKMQFNGIIITDDMQMRGALYKRSVSESSLAALKAGNDIILISRNMADYEATRNLIIRELNINPEFEKQIRKSVERIISLKDKYLADKTISVSELRSRYPIPAEGAPAFFQQQAFRSVSLLRSDKLIRKPEENERILLVGSPRLFFQEGLRRFPNANTYTFQFSSFFRVREYDFARLPNVASRYDVVIFCSSNTASLELLRTLENSRARVIVLSVLSPAGLQELDWLDGGVAVFGTGRESFAAGFAAIAGDFIPEGILPIVSQKNN